MGKFYQQSRPTFSLSLTLQYHINSLEAILQIQEKCYCNCEILQ